MLKDRVITSIVLLLIIITGLFILPENGFVVIILLMFLVAIQELLKIYKFSIYYQISILAIISLLFFLIYFIHIDLNLIINILGITSWCFIIPIILIKQPQHFSKLVIIILSMAIFIPAFYSFIAIYTLFGAKQLLSIMAIAWISDIGAYFVGKKFGQHKIALNISPGKSVEGAVAGLILVGFYLFILKYFNLVVYLDSYSAVFKFTLTLTTVGIIGDLFESWLKRVAKVKDSGTILPGHGGVLDRIDSLIAIITIAFIMIRGFV